MKKIVITGGAGFIGSHIVEHFARTYPTAEIVVLDKMTYAADIRNIFQLMREKRFHLTVGNICDLDTCQRAVQGAHLVIHAAAESHVDNSFGNSLEFTQTNVFGTHCLMEACRHEGVERIIHVSTDEVYGEVLSGTADENALLRPTNPYSASKAAAEMIISGYLRSYKLPVVMVRANNIFGIRQYPEKIIPKFMISLMMGRKLTLHGSGENRRHYLSAWDFAEALDILARFGEVGGCYNIGTVEEYTNMEMASMISALFGLDAEDTVTHVTDRPFNDFRYAVDWSLMASLGWKPKRSLRDELPVLAQWYADNLSRYESAAKAVRKPIGENVDLFDSRSMVAAE
jgi:UDP-glucose 4,6-dehydratase